MPTSAPQAPGQTPQAQIEAQVDTLLSQMSLEEKVAMMSGAGFFEALAQDDRVWGARPYRAGSGNPRLGLPPLLFTDGPRGVTRPGSTCFPCTMARGASFDADLELRIGEAMGIEARAQGCNLSGAVCINLLRHPAWGRAQETYGEDSYHLGVMGAAMGAGIQTHNVIATVKHFALNSMENARFKVDVRADARALHEVYLPHFKHCLDAGIASVMSAYNKVNGEFTGQDRVLLTDILRDEWKFDGFVHSDWVRGVHKVYGASAGLDIENPEPLVFGENLVAAVNNGTVEPCVIDRACRRILRTQLRFAAQQDPLPAYGPELIACDAHRALALESAQKCAVLLENDGTLPLAPTMRIAMLGRLAAIENTGDNGSSRVRPPYVITPLAGLQRLLGDHGITHAVTHADETDLPKATALAAQADAVVVVVGYTAKEEGEYIMGDIALGADQKPGAGRPSLSPTPIGGDRVSLSLPADQIALIHAAAASGKPVVVAIVAGSAVMVEEWRDQVNAILFSFYAGMEGGTALAQLLLGLVNPSGKLPFTVARDADHYPFFDAEADTITYDLWHGYAKLDRDGNTPRYPFGHGLSYTSFAYRALTARLGPHSIDVTAAITNTGPRPGEEVAQCYIGAPGHEAERATKQLRGFARVALAPGQMKVVRFSVPLNSLRWRDGAHWRLESGPYRVMVGHSSADGLQTQIHIPPSGS